MICNKNDLWPCVYRVADAFVQRRAEYCTPMPYHPTPIPHRAARPWWRWRS